MLVHVCFRAPHKGGDAFKGSETQQQDANFSIVCFGPNRIPKACFGLKISAIDAGRREASETMIRTPNFRKFSNIRKFVFLQSLPKLPPVSLSPCARPPLFFI